MQATIQNPFNATKFDVEKFCNNPHQNYLSINLFLAEPISKAFAAWSVRPLLKRRG